MPSPFPGMDPYLENTPHWQGFHNSFITYARDAIQGQLPSNYVATLELRIYVEREGGSGRAEPRVPDVEIVRTGAASSGANVATAEPEVALRGYWIPAPVVEHREAFINIRTVDGDEELITSIELLSPGNKLPGRGREEYLRKQRETTDAGINLVEIDLLRGGEHTIAAPAGRLEDLPEHTYQACVFRGARDWGYEVFPWTLRDLLPALPIPLAPEEREVVLELQQVFTQTYENGRFARLLRYQREPSPPLSPEDIPWADALLRKAGLKGEGSAS